MAHEPRVKTYLANWLKNAAAFISPEDLNLTDDFKIELRSEHNLGVLISIKDPSEGAPRYFEIMVKEKF